MPSELTTYPGYHFPAEVIHRAIWLYTWRPRNACCCAASTSRIVASGCDVPLLTRLGDWLGAAGAAIRMGCGVMRAQFGC